MQPSPGYCSFPELLFSNPWLKAASLSAFLSDLRQCFSQQLGKQRKHPSAVVTGSSAHHLERNWLLSDTQSHKEQTVALFLSGATQNIRHLINLVFNSLHEAHWKKE